MYTGTCITQPSKLNYMCVVGKIKKLVIDDNGL